jgi:hypothetical protein
MATTAALAALQQRACVRGRKEAGSKNRQTVLSTHAHTHKLAGRLTSKAPREGHLLAAFGTREKKTRRFFFLMSFGNTRVYAPFSRQEQILMISSAHMSANAPTCESLRLLKTAAPSSRFVFFSNAPGAVAERSATSFPKTEMDPAVGLLLLLAVTLVLPLSVSAPPGLCLLRVVVPRPDASRVSGSFCVCCRLTFFCPLFASAP